MAMFKRDDKIPKGTGYTLGGIGGALAGAKLGKKLIDPKRLAQAIQTFRTTGNAIPAVMARHGKTIPMALLLAAAGSLAGGKIQDLSGK